MADLDTIFKALRLLPEFDGNPNVLTRFIKLCDQLVIDLSSPNELNTLALINGILNKITGPAARLINSNGIPTDWIGIRNALINNFADQRDEAALYNDLALLTQGPGSPQEFYEKCQNLFATVMTYVTLHESVDTTIEAKRCLYKKLTLQAYVRGLKDPLGSRIRCMRPETIEKALEFVQEELNTMYLQQRNDHLPDRRGPIQANHHPGQSKLFNVNYNTPQPNYNKPFNISAPGPSRFHNILAPAPHQPRQSFSQYNQAGPSRTQQMFRALPPNHNPNNAFRPPPPRNPATQYPRPMSGVSHFSARPMRPNVFGNNVHDWNKSGNPPPSNYFKTREMNFNNCMNYEPNDYYYSDDYNDYNINMPYDFYDSSNYQYNNEYEFQLHDQYPQATLENVSDDQNYSAETLNNDSNKDFQLAPNLEKRK